MQHCNQKDPKKTFTRRFFLFYWIQTNVRRTLLAKVTQCAMLLMLHMTVRIHRAILFSLFSYFLCVIRVILCKCCTLLLSSQCLAQQFHLNRSSVQVAVDSFRPCARFFVCARTHIFIWSCFECVLCVCCVFSSCMQCFLVSVCALFTWKTPGCIMLAAYN